MKPLAIVIFLCVALSALSHAGQRKIAYEHGDSVWVANPDGSAAKKVAAESWPNISPDGTRLAFNTEDHSKSGPGLRFQRHIAVADIASGKVTIFKDIPSDNCFGPVWSPDGSKIAFSIMADREWRLGLVNADGSGFRLITDAALGDDTFAPGWSADGKSIFCHDLKNLYHIDLEGNVLKKWQLSELQVRGSLSSASQVSVSPDGKTLLMDVDLYVQDYAQNQRKHSDGTQPTIYKFDLVTEIATRVTETNDFVWSPRWLTNDEFLCLIQKENEDQPSIYRMSIDGQNPKLLVKHARTPSASAP